MPNLLDLDDATLTKQFSHPCERLAMASQLALREDVEKRVVQVEKQVLRQLRDDPARKAVQTVPGIGPVLGATIVLESGPMERFDQVGNYLSYCRMVTSTRWSNGKPKGRGNKRCGNRYLAWAYMEAAQFAQRFNPEALRWYQRKAAQSHPVLARKALAHKLARACFFLLRDGGSFDNTKLFG